MIQTAEGALNETHAILQRMRELTVQAGSTILSPSDRTAVGEEMLTLRNELDNIALRSRFNGLSLLTGALSVTSGASTVPANVAGATTGVVTYAVDVQQADAGVKYTFANAGADLTITNGTTNVSQTITVADINNGATQSLKFDALGITVTLTHDASANNVTGTEIAGGLNADTIDTTGSGNASFRVGSEVTDNVTVGFSDLRSSALGGSGTKLSTLIADNQAVSTTTKSDTLQAALDTAIDQVSTQRAKLGAAQNQMESAIASVAVSVENLSASESRIRDADIAEVSSELVTRQIMQQAGVSVLAQANTSPQAVLSLLQG